MRSIDRAILFGMFAICGMSAAANEPQPDRLSAPRPHAPKALHEPGPVHEPVVANPLLDRSGRIRRGKASFYARKFAGRKMADGTTMRPGSDNAASKTLPLGTTAKVTNLENGQTAIVTIRDRGPYIKGRIVDLSPSTAQAIGIDHKRGVARVTVAPIAVPLPDGSVRLGAAMTGAAKESSND